MKDAPKHMLDEGPRAFAVFLQQIEEGAFHAECSRTSQSLTAELHDFAQRNATMAKGEMTMTLRYAVDRNGTAVVTGEVKTKTPRAPRAGSIFWLTAGKNLSPENPKQTKLPLREAPPVERPRDLPLEEAQAAREVT